MQSFTYNYICHCGCGEVVAVEFTNGFAGTTCRVQTCSKAPSYIKYFDIRRSAAQQMTCVGPA